MTLEQILARARALMTEEVEVDEPVAAVAAGRHRVLPHVPVGSSSTPDKQNAVAVQATRTCGIEVSGKQGKGREVSTTLSPHKLEEVLPVMKVKVNGMDQIALVDSDCSSSVVSGMSTRSTEAYCNSDSRRKCLLSHGVGSITFTVTNRNPLKTNMLVVNSKPLGFDLVLGMDVIKKLGGLHIDERGKAHFAEAAHTLGATIELEQPDFRAEFDQHTKSWTVSWKWSSDQQPEKLYNRVPEYLIPARASSEYDKELQNRIDNEWLVPYPEDKLGSPKGLISLMAVIQQNKQKVRPVLDYRELNDHMDPFMARVDICTEKLREWRRAGSKVSVLDLCKAYLQVRMNQSLWSYQTVQFKGRRYCLTRMGFGLNLAPSIMQTIVDAILTKDKRIQQATSAYIDDVYVDESIVPAACVKGHLYSFNLLSKEPERLQDGV